MGGYETHEIWRRANPNAMRVPMSRSLLLDLVCGNALPWSTAEYVRAMTDAYTAGGVTCPADVAKEYCEYMIPKEYRRAERATR